MAMSVSEAAEKWGVTQSTVREWIKIGRIRARPLSEMLPAGIPKPKKDSWVILDANRPALNLEPIQREKMEVQEEPIESEPGVNGFGFWR